MILKSSISTKRLDHHGIVAGVIHDIGLIDEIDRMIPQYGTEEVTVGQTVASMVINGLGFTDKALSLTEDFFNLLPAERLIGPGVTAEQLNRFKLGRTLDRIYEYGCSSLFSTIAGHAVISEKIQTKVQSLDTTSFSLTGNYDAEFDGETIRVTYGYSKDHRPDLKQLVAELIVSHDGDVPLVLQMHDGNASDSTIFKNRCEALKELYDNSQVLVADSKLYSSANAKNLARINFITRIPETAAKAKNLIAQAVDDLYDWYDKNLDLSFCKYQIRDHEIDQNWLICLSQEALTRVEKTLSKKVAVEKSEIKKGLFHFQAQRFSCQADAIKAFDEMTSKWKYHRPLSPEVVLHKVFEGKGRPAKDAIPSKFLVQIKGNFEMNTDAVQRKITERACFIIGTNQLEVDPQTIIETYKSQSSVERGFRFLKDPTFFASSLYLKKPERIEALVTIMTMALLIYTIAQRRIRIALADERPFIPNSSGKVQKRPTLKRIFQLFQGVTVITLNLENKAETLIEGMNQFRLKILNALGGNALLIYSQ